MRLGAKAACAAAALALAFAAGRWTAPEGETRTEVVTEKETVTLVRTVHSVREGERTETERIVERKVAVPCRCGQTTAQGFQQGEKTEGVVVLDERIVERALASKERLELRGTDSGAVASETKASREERTSPPGWRASAGLGMDWNRSEPVMKLEVSRRVLGQVELGLWAVGNRSLQGAAGVSVTAEF